MRCESTSSVRTVRTGGLQHSGAETMTSEFHVPSDAEILEARAAGQTAAMVEALLSVLVGEPWMDFGRAADLIWIGFGDLVLREPHEPSSRISPELRAKIEQGNREPLAVHRLHVQCTMRVDGPNGPYVGSQDIYKQSEPPNDWFDEDVGHATNYEGCLFDARVAEFGAHTGRPIMVETVSADRAGGFVLRLSDGWSLAVAPASAAIREYWRAFDAGGGRHFVAFPTTE